MRTEYVTRLVNRLSLGGGAMMLDEIIRMERAHGFTVVRPGEVEWLPRADWKDSTIVSLCGGIQWDCYHRVRLVMLEAKRPRDGALTRLLRELYERELQPVMVEPHDRLAAKLTEWGWKHRRIGKDETAENLWYPRYGQRFHSRAAADKTR